MDTQSHGDWYDALSPREQATIDHALAYDAQFASAGVPGHSAHLLIAKLAKLLSTAQIGMYPPDEQLKPTIMKVTWDEASKVWRNAETGVQVTSHVD